MIASLIILGAAAWFFGLLRRWSEDDCTEVPNDPSYTCGWDDSDWRYSYLVRYPDSDEEEEESKEDDE